MQALGGQQGEAAALAVGIELEAQLAPEDAAGADAGPVLLVDAVLEDVPEQILIALGADVAGVSLPIGALGVGQGGQAAGTLLIDGPYQGRCDGDVAVWCTSEGMLDMRDCGAMGLRCDYVNDRVGYFCTR